MMGDWYNRGIRPSYCAGSTQALDTPGRVYALTVEGSGVVGSVVIRDGDAEGPVVWRAGSEAVAGRTVHYTFTPPLRCMHAIYLELTDCTASVVAQSEAA